jgi:hypothetical protein
MVTATVNDRAMLRAPFAAPEQSLHDAGMSLVRVSPVTDRQFFGLLSFGDCIQNPEAQ